MKKQSWVRRGENSPRSKLNNVQASIIKQLYRQISTIELANIFSVSTDTINDIGFGYSWRHIHPELNKYEKFSLSSIKRISI